MAVRGASRRVLARTIAAKLLTEPSRQNYWVQVLAAYLVENKRVAEADLIITDIERELFEQAGQLVVSVTSARPLNAEVRDDLTKLLTDRTKAQKVFLTEAVNPELLGGLIARTPDAELDVSIRTKLNQLATID